MFDRRPRAGQMVAASTPSVARPWLSHNTVQKIWGLLFVLPVLVLFLGLRLYPMLRAFEISFQKYDLLSKPQWIGLDNYAYVFSNERVLNSLKVTLVFVVAQAIPLVLLALVLALMLFSLPRLRHFFELTIYFPVTMTPVVAALIWLTLYYPRGLLDQIVGPWLPQGVPWLTNAGLALPSVIAVDVWKSVGYYMIILLAGLLGLPNDCIDAATMDGAGTWARIRYIILPLLRPQLVFVTIIALINTVQSFDLFYVLTRGGPADATRVLPIEIYLRGFELLEMGRASAMSMIMFVCLVFLSLAQLKLFKFEGV